QHRARRKRSDTLSSSRWSFSRTTCEFTVEQTRLKRNREEESVSERERHSPVAAPLSTPDARPRTRIRCSVGNIENDPLALRHTLFRSIPFQPCLFDGERAGGPAETPSSERECVGALPAWAVLLVTERALRILGVAPGRGAANTRVSIGIARL